MKREGIHYKKFSDVPFTGKSTKEEQGVFKDGLKEGSWVGYHKNGQLKNSGDFKNGNKEGTWITYYKNGQLLSKGGFKTGKEEGPWVIYFDNGLLSDKGNFKTGNKEGPWVGYWKDAIVSEERTGTFKNGKKIMEIPFTRKLTGKSQGVFKNGRAEGAWVKFWSNGQLMFKGDFKNGKREDLPIYTICISPNAAYYASNFVISP